MRLARRWVRWPRAFAGPRAPWPITTPPAAEAALERLRGGQSSLGDLTEAREASGRVSHRTLRGRREKDRVENLDERLAQIDLLFASALLLARATHRLLEERVSTPEWLPRAVEELARAVEALADDPESLDGRRRASEMALEAARTVAPEAEDRRVAFAADQVRLVAADVSRMAAPKDRE